MASTTLSSRSRRYSGVSSEALSSGEVDGGSSTGTSGPEPTSTTEGLHGGKREPHAGGGSESGSAEPDEPRAGAHSCTKTGPDPPVDDVRARGVTRSSHPRRPDGVGIPRAAPRPGTAGHGVACSLPET